MTILVEVFCPSCARRQLAEVGLDANGYPTTAWLEPHRDDLDEAFDRLGVAAGEAFAIAVSNEHIRAAQRFADVLARNDAEDGS